MGEDPNTRLIWEVVGRLDLRLYYGEIAAVEGHGGRDLVTNSGHEFRSRIPSALCVTPLMAGSLR